MAHASATFNFFLNIPVADNSFRHALDIGTRAFQASGVAMKFMIRLNLLVVCASLTLGMRLLADEASPPPSTTNNSPQSVSNSLLQIQEQVHAVQVSLQNIENNRQALTDAADRNTAAITAHIQDLEMSIAAERARQQTDAQKSQQWMLGLVGGGALFILLVVLFLGYLQWRSVRRLIELVVSRPAELTVTNGRLAVEQSNARLFNAVDHLEKRILGLEQTAITPLVETTMSATNGHPPAGQNDRADRIANLLADGQTLLNGNKPEQAMLLFSDVLSLEPQHPDALVKKGSALERLDRLDEAIACYDRAIATDNSLTVAYLQKGGLLNRMARYDEALQCYEQALRTQEKGLPRKELA